jgi:hypothetical protein
MTDSLLVILDKVMTGTLERLSGGRLRFDYTEEYRERSTEVGHFDDESPARPQ